MTARVDSSVSRSRALPIAFACSLLAHAVLASIATVAFPHHRRVTNDEVVTISSKIRIETRASLGLSAPRHLGSEPAASSRAPASPELYRFAMRGAMRKLRRGEGLYYPVSAWHANGENYYYVAYRYTSASGAYESGRVPWPIHFAPAVDPFTTGDPALLRNTPLPPPPLDYVPPGTLGRVLRSYFPQLVFDDRE